MEDLLPNIMEIILEMMEWFGLEGNSKTIKEVWPPLNLVNQGLIDVD